MHKVWSCFFHFITGSWGIHVSRWPLFLWFILTVLMLTSSNENISVLLAICAGNSTVAGEFPAQRPVTRSFDVFFDLRLNKQLSKQSWGWWFETLSRPFWRHCNGGNHVITQRYNQRGVGKFDLSLTATKHHEVWSFVHISCNVC